MLSKAFVWLDSHPDIYWVCAGLATLLLSIQIGLAWRHEKRGPVFSTKSIVWRDALVLFLFLFAWRWPFLLTAVEYNPDESQLIAGAITLAHDPVFWRSVDGTTSGPLNFYILLPWHWLGLPLDYFTARLTGLLLIWGALFASHRTLANSFGRVVAWLGLLPVAGFFATATYFDLIHYSSECVTLLLCAVAIWLLAGRKPEDHRRLWIACFVAGSAIWAKLQAAPLSAVLVGWGLWQVLGDSSASAKTRWKNAFGSGLAALAPTLLAMGLIVATGQTEEAYRRYVLHNLLYVGMGRTLREVLWQMSDVALVDGRMPWLLVISLTVAAVAAIYYLARHRRPPALFIAGGILTLSALVAIITPHREFLHYTLLLPIPLTLWTGAALGGWWKELPGRWHRRLFVGLVSLFLGLPLIATRFSQPVPDPFGQFAYDWRHPRSGAAEIVHALAKKGDSLGVWGWACNLYVETKLPQATRDGHSVWSIQSNAQRDYHRACYLADLRRHQPSVFVDAVGPEAFGFRNRATEAHEIFPELADYVRLNYTLVTDLGDARIYARKGLAAIGTLPSGRIAELTAHRRFANVIAPPITALDQFQKKIIARRNVVMLLPPARIEWQLDDDVREVTFGFGFDSVAYIKGKSNGVELTLELVDHQQIRTVYRRYLDPALKADDRYPENIAIALPPFAPGTHLVLRSDPGPYGDNAWDWAYVDNLQLKHSPVFLSTQFPGFNRVPDIVDANKSIIVQNDIERLLLLPGPATLTYVLHGDERRLQFEYGFQSDTEGGVTYRVELQHPGQSVTVIFERRLQPDFQAKDRHRQKIDLALTASQPGDRLNIKIIPATGMVSPNSNQTYLTGLQLQ